MKNYQRTQLMAILRILIWAVLIIVFLQLFCSCEKSRQAPDPVDVLKEQVESERGLRTKAESTANQEAELRRQWELAAVSIAIIAVVGFLVGTSLGSRGRRHAERSR